MQLAGMLAISLTAAVLQQLAQLTVSRHYVTSVWSTTICRCDTGLSWRISTDEDWCIRTPDPDPDPDPWPLTLTLTLTYCLPTLSVQPAVIFIIFSLWIRRIFNSDTTLCICSCAVIFMVLLQHSSFAVAPTGSHIWTFLNCNLSLDSLSLLNRPRG